MLNDAATLEIRELLLRLPQGQHLELQRMAGQAAAPGISLARRQKTVQKIQLTMLSLMSSMQLNPVDTMLLNTAFGLPVGPVTQGVPRA
jgi:hypothetical protein